jgi:hypothetical protein
MLQEVAKKRFMDAQYAQDVVRYEHNTMSIRRAYCVSGRELRSN